MLQLNFFNDLVATKGMELKVVKLLMNFKITHERIFCDKN